MSPIILLAVQAVPSPIAVPPAPPAPPIVSRPAVLRNPEDIAQAKDYPKAAMRAGAEGAVRFEVAVSARGKPTACRVTESSGNADLDAQTCRQVLKRAKFDPARDFAGRKIPDRYTRRIVWRLYPR